MQAGRVVLWVLLVLAGAGLSALMLTLGRSSGEGSRGSELAPLAVEAVVRALPPSEIIPAAAPQGGRRSPEARGDRASPLSRSGKLQGRMELGSGASEPVTWQLLVLDRTGDLVRTESFRGSERDFDLAIAPGDYTVRAEAPALGSQPASVQVEAQRAAPPLTIVLAGLAALSGSVRDESGAAVAGLAVLLHDPRGVAATAETDPEGLFALPPVPGGQYELLLGSLESPIVPPVPIALIESVQEKEPRIVPVLGWLELSVLDGLGRPAPQVRFSGSGDRGGFLEGETDAQGRATVRLLPPGVYRVVASHPTLGRASQAVSLGSGEGSQVGLTLRPASPGT